MQEVAGQGRAALSSKLYFISHQEQIRVKDMIWNILNLVAPIEFTGSNMFI